MFISAVIIIFYPSPLSHSLVNEDYVFIGRIKNYFSLYDTFITQFFNIEFYRPITQTIFYFISYKLFNLNPVGYHIFILALFIANNFLVFEIAEKLTQRKDLALIASIFYASRIKIHFFPVYSISAGFQETGMAFFMLCTILLYLLYCKERNVLLYISSLICSLFAALSKETSVILPALIFLLEMYLCTLNIKQHLRKITLRLIPFCIPTMIHISRLYLISSKFIEGAYSVGFSLHALVDNMIFYLTNPINQRFESFIVLIIFLTAFIFENRKYTIVSLAWFFIGLSPFLLLRHHASGYYLSISLFGFSLLFSSGIKYYYDKFSVSKYVLPPILVIIFMTFAHYNVVNKEYLADLIAQEKITNNVLTYFKNNYPTFPPNSLIYIKNSDIEMNFALGGASGIKILYSNNISVYFEGVSKKLPMKYNQVYYFYYDHDKAILQYIDKSNIVK